MFDFALLATIALRVPDWTPAVGLTMLACNVLAIFIGRYAIQRRGVGPSLPFELPDPFGAEFGVPELLATASFGHILGAGMILGLSSAGVL